MTRRARLLAAMACCLVWTVPSSGAPAVAPAKPQPAAQADSPPSVDEIQNLYTSGDYKGALQKISRVLSLKGDAAKSYDRHALLRLKAESHLKLRDTKAAADAFSKAAKEAPDEATGAEDTASETVIKRSKNLAFTPKATKEKDKPAPIDVSDPEKRKEAFAALLAEQKAELESRAKAARQAKSLPPILEGLKLVGAFRTTELAATGEETQSRELVDELGGRAHKLMAEALEDMAETVDGIEEAANDLQEVAVPLRSPTGRGATLERTYKRAGLTTDDRKDLNRVIADCKKIVPTCRELAKALGDNGGKDFEKLAEYGAEVGNKAHKVLTTRYDDNDYSRMNRAGNRMRRPVERR